MNVRRRSSSGASGATTSRAPDRNAFSSSLIDGLATSTTTTSGRSVSNARASSSASADGMSGPIATTAGFVRVSSGDDRRLRAVEQAVPPVAAVAVQVIAEGAGDLLAEVLRRTGDEEIAHFVPGSAASHTVPSLTAVTTFSRSGCVSASVTRNLPVGAVVTCCVWSAPCPLGHRRSARSSRARRAR